MRHTLQPHPSTPCSAVSAIAVEVGRSAGELVLTYTIIGHTELLVPANPVPAKRKRADELWRHTCFEAFIKPVGGNAYWELNLAPTWDWQCYGLSGYREGRHVEAAVEAPAPNSRYENDALVLGAAWKLSGAVPEIDWRLGLSAVIEDTSGAISYWALRHPPGNPDFHHDDAFAFSLPVTP